MNNNYNLDDLENFLSDSAEQHRMYPSDRVWRNIDQELHGNKSWPALTFGAVLTGAIITAGLILIHPDKNLFSVNLTEQGTELSGNRPKTAITSETLLSNPQSASTTGEHESNHKITPANAVNFHVLNNASDNARPGTMASLNDVDATEIKIASFPKPGSEEINFDTETQIKPGIKQNPGIPVESLANNIANLGFGRSPQLAILNHQKFAGKSVTIGAGLINSQGNDEFNSPSFKINESVVNTVGKSSSKNSTQLATNNSRWSLLFYTTPSISYRYLSEAKIVDLHLQNGPIAPNVTQGVNNFVRHKPIMGFEFGSGIMYQLTPSVRIRTGLQFNTRGYSIDAFASSLETSTILLNRGYYTDSLIAISSISTQDGYKPIEIQNRYWEVGVPIGMDMRVTNWKKIQIYVGAGIEPTYQFNKAMYMISNDYKKYVQEPDIVRHWNINTSLEAFLSYKAAGLTWQVGPQIRYQVLPGAINQYPVRERLIDYGLKIGVVKSLH